MKRLIRLRSSRLLLGSTCTVRVSRRHATEPAARPRPETRRTFSASLRPGRIAQDEPSVSQASEATETKSELELVAQDSELDAQEAEEIPDDAILEDGVQATPSPNTLGLPPRRKSAERPDKITDPEYVPAETGDGLEVVGGFEGWWDKGDNWNSALDYRGFVPQAKVRDAASLQVLARAAVIEALAVKQWYGVDAKPMLLRKWVRPDRSALDKTMSIGVTRNADGNVSLAGDLRGIATGFEAPEGDEAQVADSVQAGSAIIEPEEAEEMMRTMDSTWQEVPLADEALKFAIKKRILQTTGQVLLDAKVAHARTVKELLEVLVTLPKPRKLAQDPVYLEKFEALPNIKIHSRRVTPIDKEKAVGRWKLIVEELEDRGLPVTGTGNYGKHAERGWFDESLRKKGFRKQPPIDGNTPGRSETRGSR